MPNDQGAVATPPAETATRTDPKPAPPKLDHMPRWRVILHNDDVSPIEWVVVSLVEIMHFDAQDAIQHTLEAHKTGLSLLVTTHKEKAELFRDQLQTRKLTVTIEPEEDA